MKNLFTPLALLLLPSFNLKAQNVISPNNEKNGPTILRTVGDDSTVSDQEEVYQVVEQQPSFPGREELFKYLTYNVKYPIDAAKNRIEGRVLVTFVVEHDGSISNVNVANSVYPSLDKGQ